MTTDTSFLTAYANDFGFEGVFARQVEALGQPGCAVGHLYKWQFKKCSDCGKGSSRETDQFYC